MTSCITDGIIPLFTTSSPYEERNTFVILFLMHIKPYLELPKHFFPNAVSILDSFHVVKYLLGLINTYINSVMKAFYIKIEILKGLKTKITHQ